MLTEWNADVVSEVDEVAFGTKNEHLNIKQTLADGKVDSTDFAHTVIRVTLKNDERYAIDMTGAQYYWPETITPWDQYQNTKIACIREVYPFGGTVDFVKKIVENVGSSRLLAHKIVAQYVNELDDVIRIWQQMDISLSVMFKLPEGVFIKRREDLLNLVEALWQELKATNEKAGLYTPEEGAVWEAFEVIMEEDILQYINSTATWVSSLLLGNLSTLWTRQLPYQEH